MAVSNATIKALLEQGLTHDELMAKLLEESNKSTDREPNSLSFKVGEKGGVSIYGLNTRFPMSGYAEQWYRILQIADKLKAFIIANQNTLKFKRGIPEWGIKANVATE